MAEPRDPEAKGRNDDFQAEALYVPPHYPGQMEGGGRWVTIQAPVGYTVGVLWTNDRDGIGWVQTAFDTRAILFAREITDGIRQAAAAGAQVSDVFAYWSARVNIAVAAGPVQAGSLDRLKASLNA